MRTNIILVFAALMTVNAANAQLLVNDDGKVGIGEATVLTSLLTVGPSPLSLQSTCNIGLAASPKSTTSYINVGIEGAIKTLSDHTPEQNHGVRGVIDPYYYSALGRNYGATGIFSGIGTAGGTGVLGSSMFSTYYSGPNILGKYAGYFLGDVNVTGSLTASQVLTTSDMRLKENVTEFGANDDRRAVLNNLLDINVFEYNLKDKGEFDVSEEVRSMLQKERPEALEELENRKKEFSSDRHYGVSAQEILSLFPNLVREGDDGYYSVNYIELVPILIRCIQELNKELEELKAVTGYSAYEN